MKYKILTVLLLIFNVSLAETVQVTWTYPTQYCDNSDLDQRTWFLTQVIYDTESIPMPSDTGGQCIEPGDPVPFGPTLVTLDEYVNSYNLIINGPTYVRVRVCHCKNWLADFSCFYDVKKPFQDENGNWIGGEYVYLTWEALNELTGGDYSKVDEHLSCSNWKTEVRFDLNMTVPNSPIDFKTL